MLSCARIHAYSCPLTHIRHILTHMHIHRLIHMFTHTHSSAHKCSSTFSYSYMKTHTHTLPFLSFFHILAPTCVHSGSRINTKAKEPQRGMVGGRQKGKEVRTYKQQANAMLPEWNCSGIKGTRERTRAEGSLAKPCTSHGGQSGQSCSPSSYEVDGLLLTCCVHGANHFAPLPQYPVMVLLWAHGLNLLGSNSAGLAPMSRGNALPSMAYQQSGIVFSLLQWLCLGISAVVVLVGLMSTWHRLESF